MGETFGLPQWKLVCCLVQALDLEITAKGCHIHRCKFGDKGLRSGFQVLGFGFRLLLLEPARNSGKPQALNPKHEWKPRSPKP